MIKAACTRNDFFPCFKPPNSKASLNQKQKLTAGLESKKDKINATEIIDNELEKKLQHFEQYVKEKEISRTNSERSLDSAAHFQCESESEAVSLRDLVHLSKPWKPIDTHSRKFKPKLPLPTNTGALDEGTYLRIIVRTVQNPNNIYVTVVDKEWVEYEIMHREMQIELDDVSVSEKPCTWIGEHFYLLLFLNV